MLRYNFGAIALAPTACVDDTPQLGDGMVVTSYVVGREVMCFRAAHVSFAVSSPPPVGRCCGWRSDCGEIVLCDTLETYRMGLGVRSDANAVWIEALRTGKEGQCF